MIDGVEKLSLRQLYRAMSFLGEVIEDQEGATLFSPRCVKDLIEEDLYFARRDLLTELDLVFFDTTSIYFEGNGGETLGQLGHSKDHRPDLKQMIVGIIIDDSGRPICCELWPGNTADVKTMIPIVDRIRKRFHIRRFCIVSDRGMISADTMKKLEDPNRELLYILGARMRKVKEIKESVLSRAGRFREVVVEEEGSKSPSPLKVKEVWVDNNRYVICVNQKQARKDKADRELIIEKLQKQIRSNPKSLIGNKGYRKYLKVTKNSVNIDVEKIETEARFDGKWVLKTNTDLKAEEVALKYKELWQVEHLFRDMKSVLETRPVYHQIDSAIKGHVFCSFMALLLRKELEHRLQTANQHFEWNDVKQDLNALQESTIEENGKRISIRSQSIGVCGKVFQAAGVALPPTIRES